MEVGDEIFNDDQNVDLSIGSFVRVQQRSNYSASSLA